jgi:hypothetical protein
MRSHADSLGFVRTSQCHGSFSAGFWYRSNRAPLADSQVKNHDAGTWCDRAHPSPRDWRTPGSPVRPPVCFSLPRRVADHAPPRGGRRA